MLYHGFTLLTSPTFSGINEGCLEHSSGPGTGYKAVRVPDHREYHGRGDVDGSHNFLPVILNVGMMISEYIKAN